MPTRDLTIIIRLLQNENGNCSERKCQEVTLYIEDAIDIFIGGWREPLSEISKGLLCV